MFKAPYYSKDDLRERAAAFLAEHNASGTIPVNIEYIVEAGFEMDIVPVPGLQDCIEAVAYITRDLQEIRVDDFVYQHRVNRYRFSLAHELAHRRLHQEQWQQMHFHDVASWKEAVSRSIPEREYGYVEFHANFFAGLVLVPPLSLQTSFDKCVELAKQHGIDIADETSGAQAIVESYIAKEFEVSAEVVHRRLEADGVWKGD